MMGNPPVVSIYNDNTEEEDLTPAPVKPATAPKSFLEILGGKAAPSSVTPHPSIYRITPGEHYATPHELAVEPERREALELNAAREQLSAELGLKPASQQAAILSHPVSGRSAPVSVASMDFARHLVSQLIGGWASVRQQEELASQLYRQKVAYVPDATARVVSSFRWDYVLLGVAGLALVGLGLHFFLKKGAAK